VIGRHIRLPAFTAERCLLDRTLAYGSTLRLDDSPTHRVILPQVMVCIPDCSLLSCEIDNGGIDCTCGMTCEIIERAGGPVWV
jgi:hypothetical protein